MDSLIPAVGLTSALAIPVIYFFATLPHNIMQLEPEPVMAVTYTASREPLLVDLKRSQISFDEYISKVGKTTMHKAELRKTLQAYLEPKIWLFQRTPEDQHTNFNTEWAHSATLLVAKTVKDIVIGTAQEELTQEMINDIFFKDQAVWLKLNQLVLSMQRYVLNSDIYAELNPEPHFQKAHSGDKEAQDFCMLNYKTCRLEMKAFYMLKTVQENETRFTGE